MFRSDGSLGRGPDVALGGAFAFEESLGLASPTGEDLPPERVVEMIGEYFRSLPPDRFPNTFAVLPYLTAGDVDERWFGLDVLVRGLAARASDPNRPLV